MTNILAFISKPPRRAGPSDPHQSAAIVIFPGVRYERLEPKPRAKSAKYTPAVAKPQLKQG